MAARWAQRQTVIVNSALYEQTASPDSLRDRLGRREPEVGVTLGKLHTLRKEYDAAKKEATVLIAREHIRKTQVDLLKKAPQALNLPQPHNRGQRVLKKNPSDESSASCSTRCPEEGLPLVEEAQES